MHMASGLAAERCRVALSEVHAFRNLLANMRWDQFTSSQAAKWRDIADRLDVLAAKTTEGSPLCRIEAAVSALERDARDTHQRAHRRHAATGMPTREPLLKRMKQDGRGVLGIIRFLDFDRLCAFDPALGDRLLQAVAERMRGMLPPQRLLAHVDRAHLAIWFGPDATHGSARSEMEAIEYALSEAVEIGENTILPKSCSQIAEVIGDDPGTALARILAQLTIATNATCHSAVQDDSGTAEREGFSFEQDLRLAAARGELRLCYQPLIDARNVRTCGAEALIRWHHPLRGHVPPGQFVPIMEATGLAHEFGMWALNTAAREARAWQTYGLSGLRVAVNVSGHQLEREDLAKLLGRTLERHALSPSALEIELTEGVAMVDCERAARLFADIRAMGVAIAIDDFGTGYSSLSTLRKLAFDKIKIDREFVNDVDRRKDSQAICHSIIALARGLGINVLAEGVERPEEYSWLRAHGCNFFQGYFFSPPLEASAFTAFVENTQGLSAKLTANARALQQTISERLSA
jgi:EAL domain-containing protein (putative c-di-GMP-specific phosphodiesterase class I)/GGDEF domain-containing protein